MSTRPHPESARIIREARQAAGLTQKELAEKLDVTIGTIGYYERGVGQPKTDNLFALCNILHIRPADLLSADTYPNAPASVSTSGGVCTKKSRQPCTKKLRGRAWDNVGEKRSQ